MFEFITTQGDAYWEQAAKFINMRNEARAIYAHCAAEVFAFKTLGKC